MVNLNKQIAYLSRDAQIAVEINRMQSVCINDERIGENGERDTTAQDIEERGNLGRHIALIKREVSAYNPYCEALTYSTLACLGGTYRAVLNDGAAGLGKSRSTAELVQLLPRLKNVKVVSGHITPLSMYRLLYESRLPECVVIVDESFNTINNSEIQQMLRSALYSGICDWYSTGKGFKDLGIPESFEFHGRIIFNTNLINSKDFNNKALLDRVFYNKLMLSGVRIAEKVVAKKTYIPNEAIWRIIEDRILLMQGDKLNIHLTEEEQERILNFTTNRILEIGRTYNSSISMRIIERIEKLFLFFKQFFGKLDFEFIMPFAENCFFTNNEEDMIKRTLAENGGEMPVNKLAEVMADYCHFSLRTAQRRIKEYIELGKVYAPKRGMLMLKPQSGYITFEGLRNKGILQNGTN